MHVQKRQIVESNLLSTFQVGEKINRTLAVVAKNIKDIYSAAVVDGIEKNLVVIEISHLIENFGLLAAMLHIIGIYENHRRLGVVVDAMVVVSNSDFVEKLYTIILQDIFAELNLIAARLNKENERAAYE